MSAYASIEDLRSQLGGPPKSEHSAAYIAKMLHDLPKSIVVDRAAFIVKHCAGKRVLEFGASGTLHDEIVKVAASVLGIDRDAADNVIAFDLDDVYEPALPICHDPQIIICGEVLEHLSNPGWFLTRLRRQYAGVPTIITTPNAYTAVGASWVMRGKENVNVDHVAWHSPRTLMTLLTRAGFTVGDFFYYNGDGPRAEGLIVCVE